MLDTLAIDQNIKDLHAKKSQWATLALHDKIKMFQEVLDNTFAVSQAQTMASAIHKKIPEDSYLIGEEWLNGPAIQCRTLRLLIDSLREIEAEGQLAIPEEKQHTLPNGQLAVDVFPVSTIDKLLFAGFTAQVRMQPGLTKANLAENIGSSILKVNSKGGVALVLGAGNVSSIGPLDVVHKLVEGKVVYLKMNPVNDYLGEYIKQAFKPFIEQGYLKIAYGAADVGEYLCQHKQIEEIHITGSDKTHDIICYGFGEKGEQAKRENKPRLDKPITSELGNVTPIIVVPGPWSQSDIKFHAENIATQLVNNGGFNCIAARVIILDESWDLKDKFMTALGETLASLNPRQAYYPGAQQSYDKLLDTHRVNAKVYGQSSQEGVVPWTIIEDLDANKESMCFSKESFCGAMAQTSIKSHCTNDFIEKAVKFCNEKVWGTLSTCMIIHPKTQKEHAKAFEKAIDDLKYGAIGINHWSGLVYGLGSTTWGAYPGHTWDNIQSGQGTVHNTYLFDKPEKSVLYGPFKTPWRMPFKPAWFATNTAMPKVAKALVAMEHSPSLLKLPALLLATIQGAWSRHMSPIFIAIKAKIGQIFNPQKTESKKKESALVILRDGKTPIVIKRHITKSEEPLLAPKDSHKMRPFNK